MSFYVFCVLKLSDELNNQVLKPPNSCFDYYYK